MGGAGWHPPCYPLGVAYLLLAAAAFIAELASLVLVGSYVGWLWTFGLLALAVVAGVALLSGRGPATVREVVRALAQGRSPGPAIVDGALFALAGILFITPGFASDVMAVGLLLPPVRSGIRGKLKAWAAVRWKHGFHPDAITSEADGIDVIDATGFERRDDEPPRGRSLPS